MEILELNFDYCEEYTKFSNVVLHMSQTSIAQKNPNHDIKDR
jgi:hypothetical protein